MIQTGKSVLPQYDKKINKDIEIKSYDYKETIIDDISMADFVVAHAGIF